MGFQRPNPALWLYYQFSGRLPAQYREWVLHDGTCRSWTLRAVIRGLLQIMPLALVLFTALGLLGGSWPLAAGSLLLGVLVVVRIALIQSVHSVDARLARHGFPPAHGSTVRAQLDAEAAERYRATWRHTD